MAAYNLDKSKSKQFVCQAGLWHSPGSWYSFTANMPFTGKRLKQSGCLVEVKDNH
jgi:hypothetical protein